MTQNNTSTTYFWLNLHAFNILSSSEDVRACCRGLIAFLPAAVIFLGLLRMKAGLMTCSRRGLIITLFELSWSGSFLLNSFESICLASTPQASRITTSVEVLQKMSVVTWGYSAVSRRRGWLLARVVRRCKPTLPITPHSARVSAEYVSEKWISNPRQARSHYSTTGQYLRRINMIECPVPNFLCKFVLIQRFRPVTCLQDEQSFVQVMLYEVSDQSEYGIHGYTCCKGVCIRRLSISDAERPPWLLAPEVSKACLLLTRFLAASLREAYAIEPWLELASDLSVRPVGSRCLIWWQYCRKFKKLLKNDFTKANIDEFNQMQQITWCIGVSQRFLWNNRCPWMPKHILMPILLSAVQFRCSDWPLPRYHLLGLSLQGS